MAEKEKKSKNTNLSDAKTNKKDEFYTQLEDIEKELKHYKKHFKDKIVFLNCDDPEESMFWKYFEMNFDYLGLKKLVATHYNATGPTYKLVLEKDVTGDGKVDGNDIVKTALKQNGDFRSGEAQDILDECDIVVTNPPFSLFREYVAQLMLYEKDFLIIGNMNAITYKEIFPLIKGNKIWLGNGSNLSMLYESPYKNTSETNKSAVLLKGYDANKFIIVPSINWYTNLSHDKRNTPIFLFKTYKGNEEDYPKYENYNAIEVSRVANIPKDYKGMMGVPITFLGGYNPKQFEIIWQACGNTKASAPKEVLKTLGYVKHKEDRGGCGIIDGERKYARIIIKKK